MNPYAPKNPYASDVPTALETDAPVVVPADPSRVPPAPRRPSGSANSLLFPSIVGLTVFGLIWLGVAALLFFGSLSGQMTDNHGHRQTLDDTWPFIGLTSVIGVSVLVMTIVGRFRRARAFRDGTPVLAKVVSFEDVRGKRRRVLGKRLSWRGVDNGGRPFEGSLIGDHIDYPQREYFPEMPIVVLFHPQSRVSTLWVE